MKYIRQSNVFMFEGVPFSENPKGRVLIMHEVLLMLTFSQTKREVNSKKRRFYDLCYTIIGNLSNK